MNEDDLGEDQPGAGPRLRCKISVDGRLRRSHQASCPTGLGHCIRASVMFDSPDGKTIPFSARLLAYVDPATGKAVCRLGMFDISKPGKGKEVGQQLVWESDEPCVLIGDKGE